MSCLFVTRKWCFCVDWGFSAWALRIVGVDHSRLWELPFAEAASLASAHQVPGVAHPQLQLLPNVPSRTRSPPVKNHWSRGKGIHNDNSGCYHVLLNFFISKLRNDFYYVSYFHVQLPHVCVGSLSIPRPQKEPTKSFRPNKKALLLDIRGNLHTRARQVKAPPQCPEWRPGTKKRGSEPVGV